MSAIPTPESPARCRTGVRVDGIQVIEGEVRELIRRQRLDPAQDRAVVDELVREVVRDYEERSLHGGLAPLGDRDGATRSVIDAVAGLGPLQQYLDDPTVEEIWIYDFRLLDRSLSELASLRRE